MLLHQDRFGGTNLTDDGGAFLDWGRADDSDTGRRDLTDADVAGLDLGFFVGDIAFRGDFTHVLADDLAPDGDFADIFTDDPPRLRLLLPSEHRLRAGARERLRRWRRSSRSLRRWGDVPIIGLGFRLVSDDFPTDDAASDDALGRFLDNPFHGARFRHRDE